MQPIPEIRRERIAIDGHTVAADVHLLADGRPPVLFVHGILASIDLARELFVDPSAESWIALSLPGHHPGRLPDGAEGSVLDEALLARLYETALEHLVGSSRVIASGWSTGGFAALNLAIRHPHRVAAVASLAGFASGRGIGGLMGWVVWLAGRPLGRRVVSAGLRMAAAWPWLHRTVLGLLAADGRASAWISPETARRMHAGFASHDPESLVRVLAALRGLAITEALDSIGVPVWIAAGGDDEVVPLRETQRLARRIPGATLRVYDGAGHLFFCEWPRLREDFAEWRRALSLSSLVHPLPQGEP